MASAQACVGRHRLCCSLHRSGFLGCGSESGIACHPITRLEKHSESSQRKAFMFRAGGYCPSQTMNVDMWSALALFDVQRCKGDIISNFSPRYAGIDGISYQTQEGQRLPRFEPQQLLQKTRRTVPCAERPAHSWSAEEAYFRTGVWSAAGNHEDGDENGGMLRSMPLFAADARKQSKGHGDCRKHQYASGALNPGILVCSSPVPSTIPGLCLFV
jgi:hypothetical protein